MEGEIAEEELARLESYVFLPQVYVWSGEVRVRELLEELEELKAAEKVELLDVYFSLRLLGYRHLAYLVELPQGEPWDEASERVRWARGLVAGSIVFPSWILYEDALRRGLEELWTWLEHTDWRSVEFGRLVEGVMDLWLRYGEARHRARPELVAQPRREEWGEEDRLDLYGELNLFTRTLRGALEVADRHEANLLIVLLRD